MGKVTVKVFVGAWSFPSAKRGWIRGPQSLIEHCNDRASEEGTEQRSVYSQATHFRGGVIRRADKSKQNSLVEIGRGSYHHSEGRREDETERGKNSVQVIFVIHGRKCGFLVVSMVNSKWCTKQTYITRDWAVCVFSWPNTNADYQNTLMTRWMRWVPCYLEISSWVKAHWSSKQGHTVPAETAKFIVTCAIFQMHSVPEDMGRPVGY